MSSCEFAEGLPCDKDAEFIVWGSRPHMDIGGEHFSKLCLFHSNGPGKKRERIDGALFFLGSRVALARGVCGVSRDDLAETIGISEMDLWEWEVHNVEPDDEAIGRMIKGMLHKFPPGFYSDDSVSPGLGLGTMAFHAPDDVCRVCKSKFAEAECDAVFNGHRCDLPLCADCRVRPGPRVDYCPDHAKKIDAGDPHVKGANVGLM